MYKDTFDFGIYTAEGMDLPYRIHMPENRKATEKIPAVLFLHGAGERGNDNDAQLKIGLDVAMADEQSPLYGAMIIAPQCPLDMQWVSADWSLGNYRIAEHPETLQHRLAVKLLLEKCEEYNCDKSRIYVMGISMGGFGVWDALARYPEVFAAGYACCGAGDPTYANVLKDIAIYTFHGDIDEEVPVSGTREMVAAIKEAGGKKIYYTEYPNTHHWSWDKAYGEKECIAAMFGERKR